jgi:hypothetical protein
MGDYWGNMGDYWGNRIDDEDRVEAMWASQHETGAKEVCAFLLAPGLHPLGPCRRAF